MKCKKSLLYYLRNYVWLQDRSAQAVVPWQEWEHLVRLIDIIQAWIDQPVPRKPSYILVFKSRQIGLSTLLAAIAAYFGIFFESTKVLELSQKETDASELLDKSRFIIHHHPEWLKLKLEPDQMSQIGIPATNSKIHALPSTENAGRSTDATMVIADEWEYHPYAEQNFAAVKPTIDKGGIFIGVSTVNKLDMTSFPKVIWRGAKAGDNNFQTLFFGWTVVPWRDNEWYKGAISGLPDWQKEQEYPGSEEEALSVPKTTGFFDREAIEDMMKDIAEPNTNGKVRIWKKSVSDRKYVMAVDPSQGKEDPSVGVVMDWATEEILASFNGKSTLDEQAKLTYQLYQLYNQPLLAVERNAGGLTLVEKLLNIGVKNWYFYRKDSPGWWTQVSNRPVMLNELAEAVSLRLIRVPNRDALQEFLDFQWIDGKPQAVKGGHDDWVIAIAIAHQIRKAVKPKFTAHAVSIKYRQ